MLQNSVRGNYMANYSPLRYPGGKGKLTPYIETVLQLNCLEGQHYAEPFAGGAAVALSLLFTGKVSHIHINDLDWAVFSFWKSVIDHTEELIERIKETPVSMETWLHSREIKKTSESHSIIDAGFATFFLNRTNRSGILNGGVIGGLSQTGEWKMDCRFNKEALIDRIQLIGARKNNITVTNYDASYFLDEHMRKVSSECLIYIDPPYYVKGAYLYRNHFKHEDHVSLSCVVKTIQRHKWFVSYDNVEQVRRIYADCAQQHFNIGYSARNYEKGAEVMIFGPNLKYPEYVFTSKAEFKAYKDAIAR